MKNLIKNEQGVALLIALGAFVIVSMLGAAALTIAGGSINQTIWDRSSNQAFNIAEGGFDWAVSRARQGTLTSGTYHMKLMTGEASVTVSAVNGSTSRVKSVGAEPDFADPKAKRAVEGKVSSLDPYNVFLAGGAAGRILGSTVVNGPLYVHDYMTWSGNGALNLGPLYIKDTANTTNYAGDLELSGSAAVGTAAQPIEAYIDGVYPSGNPNFHVSAVYTDVPDLDMPNITGSVADMTAQRSKANIIIDGDPGNPPNGNYNAPTGLKLDKAAAAPQVWGVYPGGNYLRWSSTGAKTRRLEIKGVIFIDGPVAMGGTGGNQLDSITYTGRGTIIVNGNIGISSVFTPNPTSEFPNTSAIGFITGYQMDINAKTGDDIYAVVYANARLNFVNQVDFFGSAMTQLMDVQSNPTLNITTGLNKNNVPPGMPDVNQVTTITDWRETTF